jgi:NADH-quinone oxidoreductase subunit I
MSGYFRNIGEAVSSLWDGMRVTLHHFNNKKKLNATLQYPHEKWPLPDRAIGFEEQGYNIIRSRLHVDIDDCIGCMKCERACPVSCIKIETVKAAKGTDLGETSNGSGKRLLVARFDIDMAECCYCNLCTYPCPEECIFMVGGPNTDKHEIDYEFSERDRNDLVYQFASASDELVAAISAEAGVADPRVARAERIAAYYQPQPTEAAVAEAAPVATKAAPAAIAKPAGDAKPAHVKIDVSALSSLDDRMVRGVAKKSAMGAARKGLSGTELVAAVKQALEDDGKLTDDVAQVVDQLATAEITGGAAASPTPEKAAAPVEPAQAPEVKSAEPVKVDLTILNAISDRMARSKAKAVLAKVTRQGGTVKQAADEIRTTLSGLGKLDGEIEEILTQLEGSS